MLSKRIIHSHPEEQCLKIPNELMDDVDSAEATSTSSSSTLSLKATSTSDEE